MATATQLFAEQGYHDTSVAEVVSELGVGKGVFYWYFDSKEALFLSLLLEGLRGLRRAQQRAIEGEVNTVERVVRGIRASIDFLAGHPHLFKLFEFAATDSRFAPDLQAGIEVAVADTVRHLKDAVVEDRIPDTDPYFIAHGIVTITMYFARRFFIPAGPRPDVAHDKVVQAAVDFCLHGMGVQS